MSAGFFTLFQRACHDELVGILSATIIPHKKGFSCYDGYSEVSDLIQRGLESLENRAEKLQEVYYDPDANIWARLRAWSISYPDSDTDVLTELLMKTLDSSDYDEGLPDIVVQLVSQLTLHWRHTKEPILASLLDIVEDDFLNTNHRNNALNLMRSVDGDSNAELYERLAEAIYDDEVWQEVTTVIERDDWREKRQAEAARIAALEARAAAAGISVAHLQAEESRAAAEQALVAERSAHQATKEELAQVERTLADERVAHSDTKQELADEQAAHNAAKARLMELTASPAFPDRLVGPSRSEFQTALLDAFRNPHDLQALTLDHLEVRMATISTHGSLKEQVFDLVEWAESHGKLRDLLVAVQKERGKNTLILKFMESLPRIKEEGSMLDQTAT